MLFILVLAFLIGASSVPMTAFAGWGDVKPCIQSCEFNHASRCVELNDANILIAYTKEVKWSAYELRVRLDSMASVTEPEMVQISSHDSPIPCSSTEGCPDVIIRMGLWYAMEGAFSVVQGPQAFRLPTDEEYRIWVSPNSNIYIASANARGMNYAVSSFCQAVDQDPQAQYSRISCAFVRDFPTFPRRFVNDCIPLSAPNAGWPGGPEVHADAVLRLAKDVMLDSCKANTLIHYGSPTLYEGSGAGQDRLDSALRRLRLGTNSLDAWPNFHFDWVENIYPWTRPHNDFRRWNAKSLQLQSICRVDSVVGNNVWIVPSDTILIPNNDFQDGWEEWSRTEPCWTIVEEEGNRFARASSFLDDTVFISRSFHVQDHVGNPSRRLIYEFSMRVHGGPAKVIFWQLFDYRRHQINYQNDDTVRFKDLHWKERVNSWTHKNVSDTNWQKYSVFFHTLGVKWDSIIVTINRLPGCDSVDFDDVYIYEGPVNYVYLSQPEYAIISYDGETRAVVDSSQIFYSGDVEQEYSTILQLWRNPDVKIIPPTGMDTIQADDPLWRVDFRYHEWGDLFWMTYFTDTLPSNSRAYVRIDHPEWVDSVAYDHMDWFKNRFDSSGFYRGMKLSGFFSKENECRFQGYMSSDSILLTDPSLGYYSYADVYGYFVSEMHDALQNLPDGEPRPLFIYADMFNCTQNGNILTRHSNPFPPINGQQLPSCTLDVVPGVNPNAHIVFVDWWAEHIHDGDLSARYLFDRWENVPDPSGNWEVNFARQTVDTLFWTEADTLALRDLVNMAKESREEGKRFTGGGFVAFTDSGGVGPNFECHRNFVDFLRLYWKLDPPIAADFAPPFSSAADSVMTLTVRTYPVPYPEVPVTSIQSVVLQYRFNFEDKWSTTELPKQADSTYTFELNLPDSGGVVEYRVWSFDDFGRYSSYPARDTKWTDPDAGERAYFTFERRRSGDIDSPYTIYTPGIVTRPHVIGPDGSVTVQPLPGYPYSTLYVADSAIFKKSLAGVGEAQRFVIAGNDSQQVRIALADSAQGWGGFDVGLVEFSNVVFEKGTGGIAFSGIPEDSVHILSDARFEVPVTFEDTLRISGNAFFADAKLDSAAVVTLEPGTEFSFADTARFVVTEGSRLVCQATEMLPIVFKADVDTLRWLGIQIERGAVDTPEFENCQIRRAEAGLLLDRAIVRLADCEFTDCHTGLLAINGGIALVEDCGFAGNKDGLIAANLSLLNLKGTAITGNAGPGVLGFSRSTIYLEDCEVDSNGGDGTAGGIGLYTGSSAFLRCNEVNENTGSGVTAFGGALMMSSVDTVASPLVNWRGNSLYNNRTVKGDGQIALRGRVGLGLYNGHNWIADSACAEDLIHWEDQPTRDWWRNVYWGTTDTTAILSRLPDNVLLASVDTNWSECPDFAGDAEAPDSVISVFLDPHNDEIEGDFGDAKTGYRNILESTVGPDYACVASDRLLSVDLAAPGSFDSTRLYLLTIADTTSDLPLARWLCNSGAWCWAEVDSFDRASAIYDSLASFTPELFDRISARVQKQMLSIRRMPTDTFLAASPQVIAHLDTARKLLEGLRVWTEFEITDSVVMYAPCYVNGQIEIKQGGILTILPHPGSQNPAVTFGSNGSILVTGFDQQWPMSKLYVLGEANNHVTLEWDSCTAFSNIYSINAYIELKHAELEGCGWGICNDHPGLTRLPIFKADSCEFRYFGEGLWFLATDTSSYLRNSTLYGMGGDENLWLLGFGTSLTTVDGAYLHVENCVIDSSGDVGVFNYYNDADLILESTVITGGSDYGILNWEGGNLSLLCCDIASNGDTLAELWVEQGAVDILESHTRFADSTGLLLYSGDPSYVDLKDGENGFELWSDLGCYIRSGDTMDVWDVSMNNWSPVTPEDTNFYSYLYPTNPAKWNLDTSLTNFLACGEGGSAAVIGGTIITTGESEGRAESYDGEENVIAAKVISQNANMSVKSADPLGGKSAESSATAPDFSIRKQYLTKSQRLQSHHAELVEWRTCKDIAKSGDRVAAVMAVTNFIEKHPDSKWLPVALVRLANLVQRGESKTEISKFLAAQSYILPDEETRTLARRLSFVAMAREGKASEALTGLEGMIEHSQSSRDSIKALVDALGVYFFNNRDGKLKARLPQVQTQNLPELRRRVIELAKTLDGSELATRAKSSAIPTEYCLYQNYPNPFNPTTEIRFDLPEAVRTELKVFNILGQEVVTLIDDVRPAGAYRVLWDSKNTSGISVASGVYVYQIKAGKFSDAKKMVLIR